MITTAASSTTVVDASSAVAPAFRLSPVYGVLIWLPLAFVAAGAMGLWHFVSFAFVSNPVLNGLILAVALWGASTMVGHVRLAYTEYKIFSAGMDWLRRGEWSSESNPRLGPHAFVVGMLGRLEKLGLGHNISIQSAVTEPEIDALNHHFEQKQDLSQFLVGLMVGLGLLGTFVGLLETLLATSNLISSIATTVGGAGGSADGDFARIVGGLQKPLAAMGTAFSASMFGLIGSIMLGFQMVIVKRTCTAMVDHVREQLLALAEKASGGGQIELSERFLATLMADMLEQHRQTGDTLSQLVNRLADFAPRLERAVEVNERLAVQFDGYAEALVRTTSAVSLVRDVVPMMTNLADHSAHLMSEVGSARVAMDAVIKSVPDLQSMRGDMMVTLAAIDDLGQSIKETHELTSALSTEVARQTDVSERLDAALSNAERERLTELRLKPTVGAAIKASIKRMLDDDDQRNAS
jgi:hypothetical protein